jgi:hypothetical protein
MRPGCDRRAAACLTYDSDSSEVWLEDPRTDDEPAQVVCSLHAESLTVPLGWKVTDRRSPRPDAVDPVPAQESGSQAALELDFEPEPEPEYDPEPEREPVADRATPRRPKPKRTSLLDRAFEWTGPQHSVLTTRAPAAPEDEPASGE